MSAIMQAGYSATKPSSIPNIPRRAGRAAKDSANAARAWRWLVKPATIGELPEAFKRALH